MAYTSVKVIFEIGHEAVIRPKISSKGMTHDWELFIRGAENTDIQHFVEKVVFYLHHTFDNPTRVVKEPPFVVRESGYASFLVNLDVYLKSKPPSEPKISFKYDLILLSGVPNSKIVKEKYIFSNPTEDFRRKLIRSGGVGVGSESSNSHLSISSDDQKLPKIKSSPTDIPSKKIKKESTPKHEEQQSQNEFSMLFGTPIIKNKIPSIVNSKSSSKIAEKSAQEKTHSSTKTSKSSSVFKEKEKDKDRTDKEKKEKDKSNVIKIETSKKDKKDDKILKPSKEDFRKKVFYDEKSKEKEKSVEKAEKESKVGKKDKNKKNKDGKKTKSQEKHNNIETKKGTLSGSSFVNDCEKSSAKENLNALNDDKTILKPEEREPKDIYNNENVNVNSASIANIFDNLKKEDKHKHSKHKKEKPKDGKQARHDKKERKGESKAMSKDESPKRPKKPLKKLFEELIENSSSNVSSSDDEVKLPKKELLSRVPAAEMQELKADQYIRKSESKKKSKKSSEDKESKKRKRKSKHKNEENGAVKLGKYDDSVHVANAACNRNANVELQQSGQDAMLVESRFTNEYIDKLKELQRKIMSLDDNSGLQQIVQLVAETGQYEITTRTFDFDLCSLDEAIVQQLLDFFVS